MDPARAGTHRRDRGGRGEAEVVVTVEVDGDVRTDELARPAHQRLDGLGRGDPERVDGDDLLRAGLHRRPVGPFVERGLGARAVDAEVRDPDALTCGERDGVLDAAEQVVGCDAVGLELAGRDGRLDHTRLDAELDQSLDIGAHGAREAPDLGAEAGGGDAADGLVIVFRDPGEAGLDAAHAELVQQPRDLELLARVEHHADRLLAVAQRRVVEADLGLEAERVVELARVDHVRTTPSGKRESFSGPSAVTRKLSSRRRPPPPSQ